jgi:hypothetical protein
MTFGGENMKRRAKKDVREKEERQTINGKLKLKR